jgi:hypothetical protein
MRQPAVYPAAAAAIARPPLPCRSAAYLPDELIVVEKCSVFHCVQAFLHPIDKRLDFQVSHFVQWEEADPTKNVK